MKIGLYFGSFNPIHIGHLIIAEAMRDALQLDKVWFVVSPHNPLKSKASLAHEHDRYEMVRLAVDDNPYFQVSDIEFRLPQPNYTIDTLRIITEKRPNDEFVLIMGEDNLRSIHRWKNYQSLLELYSIAYYPRAHEQSNDYKIEGAKSIIRVNAINLDISSSYIRKALSLKRSIKYMVPVAAVNYIINNRLYNLS